MSARREFSYRKTWRIGAVVGLDVHVQADILRVRCIIREATKVAGADGDTVNLLRVPEAYRKEKLCYANTFELRLEDLRKANNLADASIYAIMCTRDSYAFCGVHNRLALSLGSRETFSEQVSSNMWKPLVNIHVPFAEATFEEMGLFVSLAHGQFLISTGAAFVPSVRRYTPDTLCDDSDLPRVVLESDTSVIPADGKALFRVKVLKPEEGAPMDYPLDVYLEANAGYLPKRKVRCVGTEECSLHALGLARGDTIRVKAGFRYLTNRAHLDFHVTEKGA